MAIGKSRVSDLAKLSLLARAARDYRAALADRDSRIRTGRACVDDELRVLRLGDELDGLAFDALTPVKQSLFDELPCLPD